MSPLACVEGCALTRRQGDQSTCCALNAGVWTVRLR
jgi:hypothetical protein